jgi:Domain of unknown function (DUF4148)
MKTLTLKTLAVASGIVALASISVLPVYADTPEDESIGAAAKFESTKSRDEVQQEYFQAMKNGGLVHATDIALDADTPALADSSPSDVQRDDVYAETVEWLRTKSEDIGMGE